MRSNKKVSICDRNMNQMFLGVTASTTDLKLDRHTSFIPQHVIFIFVHNNGAYTPIIIFVTAVAGCCLSEYMATKGHQFTNGGMHMLEGLEKIQGLRGQACAHCCAGIYTLIQLKNHVTPVQEAPHEPLNNNNTTIRKNNIITITHIDISTNVQYYPHFSTFPHAD
ncbi:hypothetical protein ACJX0J_026742 [Zea mays]